MADITAGEVKSKFDAVMDGFDRFQWESYINPLTGETETPTAQELAAIKTQTQTAYADMKQNMENYARQIGMINGADL